MLTIHEIIIFIAPHLINVDVAINNDIVILNTHYI